jgi:alkylation response protein AidB-like acyl-CoA dehydrogenase
MLIVDVQSPGVEVRPITQITGHAEFCEVFFDDVVVPKENLLGERGDGWKIAMHTVGHERGTAALPRQVKLRTWVDRAVREAAEHELLDDPATQQELARALIGVEVLRHHAYRTVGEFLSGGAVGPESSVVKLLMAEAEQRVAATAFDLLGDDDFWSETYLYSRAASVYGGTQQIQRSIIADRVLGLPKE